MGYRFIDAKKQQYWTCPFCKMTATRCIDTYGLSERRICDCGAIAFSARPNDVRGILIDAYDHFGVDKHMPDWNCNADVVNCLTMAGYEMRQGDCWSDEPHMSHGWLCWWVRKLIE